MNHSAITLLIASALRSATISRGAHPSQAQTHRQICHRKQHFKLPAVLPLWRLCPAIPVANVDASACVSTSVMPTVVAVSTALKKVDALCEGMLPRQQGSQHQTLSKAPVAPAAWVIQNI